MMRLQEALNLSKNKRAHASSVADGWANAMVGGGYIYVSDNQDGKLRLREIERLDGLDKAIRDSFLSLNWQPVAPVDALTALAQEAEDGTN